MAKSKSKKSSKKPTVLVGVTASIAAYKACELIRLLQQEGCEVAAAMSKDAKHFITPLTLETLTNRKVVKNMFKPPEKRDPAHISLAEEADLILIAPATADVIGKIASGICDDILTCTVCASRKPVLFAPAMNDSMYTNSVITDKIRYLKSKGYHFVDPVVGHLACGREGIGHLAPLDLIVKKAKELLK